MIVALPPAGVSLDRATAAFDLFQFLPQRRSFARQIGDGLPQLFIRRLEIGNETDRLTPGFGVILSV
jgi:hypothetical protein